MGICIDGYRGKKRLGDVEMRFCNRAIKATVGVNIVGCYYECTAVEKYRIIRELFQNQPPIGW